MSHVQVPGMSELVINKLETGKEGCIQHAGKPEAAGRREVAFVWYSHVCSHV